MNINLSNHSEADSLINRLKSRFKNTPYYHSVKWYKAWNYYLSQRYEESFKAFNGLIFELEKDGRADLNEQNKARYWMARSLQKAGEEGQAIMAYKELSEQNSPSYYSILSSLRLNKILKDREIILTMRIFYLFHGEKRNLQMLIKLLKPLNL